MNRQLHERLGSVYLEMPGLRLTASQATRLCGVEDASVGRVLAALADERFLRRMPNGEYGLRGTCPVCE